MAARRALSELGADGRSFATATLSSLSEILLPVLGGRGDDRARMSVESLVAHAGELTALSSAEAAGILYQVLKRVDQRSDALAKAFASAADVAGQADGWLGAVCPLLLGIRLLAESEDDAARQGQPTLRPRRVDVDDESRTVAQVFPTKAWHRAVLPTTTAEVWLKPSATEEAHHQASRTTNGAGDSRVAVVHVGAGIEGALNALHHVMSNRQPVLWVSSMADAETARLRVLDEVLEPLVEKGWLERVRAEEVDLDATSVSTLHLGPGAGLEPRSEDGAPDDGAESSLVKRAAELGLLHRDASGLTPLVVLPYLYERKELVAVARWVTAQHRSPMPWLGPRVLVLPGNWRQAEAFKSLLRDELGEEGLCESTLEEIQKRPRGRCDKPSSIRPLDVVTVGSNEPEAFLQVAAAELAPLSPTCTAFAVDPLFETDPRYPAMLDRALSRWPSRVLVINHSPEVAYALTSLPWPAESRGPAERDRPAEEAQLDASVDNYFDRRFGMTAAHNGAQLLLDQVDRVVVRRRLWPYPRFPWELGAGRKPQAAMALAALLAAVAPARWPARWLSLLWAIR